MTDNKAPSLFERIGGAETVNALVSAYFRELHTQPRAPTLCGFYSKATDHYQTRMVEYITGFLGGPGALSAGARPADAAGTALPAHD